MTTNTVIILVGLPCSGKSTWVKNNIPDDGSWVVISSDKFIEQRAKLTGRSYRFIFEDCIEEAETFCKTEFAEAIASNKNIVIDRTNLSVSSRRKWLACLKKTTTKIALVFSIDDDELFYRNQIREQRTGKIISFDVFANMSLSFENPSEEEGFNLIRKIG